MAPPDDLEAELEWFYRHQDPLFLERNLKKVFAHERRLVGITASTLAKTIHNGKGRVLEPGEGAPSFKAISELTQPAKKFKFSSPDDLADVLWHKSAKKAEKRYSRADHHPVVDPKYSNFQRLCVVGTTVGRFVPRIEGLLVLSIQTGHRVVELNITTGRPVHFRKMLGTKSFTNSLLLLSDDRVGVTTKTLSEKFPAPRTSVLQISAHLYLRSVTRTSEYRGEILVQNSSHQLSPLDPSDRPIGLAMDISIVNLSNLSPASLTYNFGERVLGPYNDLECPFTGRKFSSLGELLSFHACYHPSLVFRPRRAPNGDLTIDVAPNADNKKHSDKMAFLDDSAVAGLDEFYYISPLYASQSAALEELTPRESFFS